MAHAALLVLQAEAAESGKHGKISATPCFCSSQMTKQAFIPVFWSEKTSRCDLLQSPAAQLEGCAMHEGVERMRVLPSLTRRWHTSRQTQGIRNEWWAITSVSSCPYWLACLHVATLTNCEDDRLLVLMTQTTDTSFRLPTGLHLRGRSWSAEVG